jgi:hypothetical protein
MNVIGCHYLVNDDISDVLQALLLRKAAFSILKTEEIKGRQSI